MEQRPLRLGDILDDYCPRERRVTNHAVVAMLEEAVKQTRCTTCDAEHPYKGGKAPRRRTKATTEEAVIPVVPASPAPDVAPVSSTVSSDDDLDQPVLDEPDDQPPVPAPAPLLAEADESPEALAVPQDEGPVHRRLIRATLPRVEGQKEARALPDFTIRQPTGGRSGNVRDNGNHRGDNRGNQVRNPDRARFGARSGQPGQPGQPGRSGQPPRGQNAGFRSAQPPQQRRNGRKRSR